MQHSREGRSLRGDRFLVVPRPVHEVPLPVVAVSLPPMGGQQGVRRVLDAEEDQPLVDVGAEIAQRVRIPALEFLLILVTMFRCLLYERVVVPLDPEGPQVALDDLSYHIWWVKLLDARARCLQLLEQA